MTPIRYRRTSVRAALGITTEEKRIKRELGITALLKPFRWWGNEKRTVKRDLGYYSPEVKFARHVLPGSIGRFLWRAASTLATLLVVGGLLYAIMSPATPPNTATISEPARLR